MRFVSNSKYLVKGPTTVPGEILQCLCKVLQVPNQIFFYILLTK